MNTIRHLRFSLILVVAACSSNDDNNNPTVDAPGAVAPEISLSTAGNLGSHLVDAQGKTLYFFANDLAGSNASTYSGAAWPTFDAASPTVGTDLVATDFSRFDRGGGVFQTTWKGRPLYYYASDTAATPTAGEGVGGRWFVARDYTMFFGANAGVTPQGGTADAPFLTDGAGRTLYVFQNDTRAVGTGAPTSACGSGPCATNWPLWPAPADLSSVVLPSTIQAANLTAFTNGTSQFVYMGWPLYYYVTDTSPGEVAGASIAKWYTANVAWNGTLTP